VSAPWRTAGSSGMAASLLDHYDEVQDRIRHRCGCPELAADVMQDAFLRLLRAPPVADPIQRPAAFLQRVAGRLLCNRIRAERSRGRQDAFPEQLPCAAPDPQRLLEQREALRLLLATVDALPPRCRQVFLRSRVDRLGYTAIARDLGIAPSTVEKHMIKALCAIRACRRRIDEGATAVGR